MATGAISAALLRRELSARGEAFAQKRKLPYQLSYGEAPTVVFEPASGEHGNFVPVTFRSIQNHPAWLRRLKKVHAQARASLPRCDRQWCELDSCNSSDALLMNVFCHPETLGDGRVASLLGVDRGSVPEFGVRGSAPMRNRRTDRTEIDMVLGELLVEAKLTETDFQTASRELVENYRDLGEVFDRRLLPLRGKRYEGYQLIRNVLAAYAADGSFCVLADERRPDLRERWFAVMRAIRSAEVRTRCKMLTWQELARVLPSELQAFLAEKYGIGCEGYALEYNADHA